MADRFRFKDYEFTINPDKFQMGRRRILKVFQPPLQRNRTVPKPQVQDLGLEPMMVSGEGTLIGDDPMEEYTKLYQLFLQQGSGLLHIPGIVPFHCHFESLSMTGKAGPKLLTYQFVFVEDSEKNNPVLHPVKTTYLTRSGDTVSLLAMKAGMELDEFLEKNPHLDVTTEIKEGTMVWLS